MATDINLQRQVDPNKAVDKRPAESPRITIFGVPKPFLGHVGVIQRNALRSWKSLQPFAEVILFGDDVGTAAFADDMGLRHIPDVARNRHGTPLLDDVFASVDRVAAGDVLVYVNCDIIFLSDLSAALSQLSGSDLSEYLVIGRRIDIDVTEMLDFERPGWETQLRQWARRHGTLAPVVCKDYFAFPRGMYASIPSFAIGRGNWDNWMVHHALSHGVPVIDGTPSITALHQSHDYAHLSRGRREAYVVGEEAESNRQLAGGRHLVSGCAATWRLEHGSLRKFRRPRSTAFLRDLPRFTRLLGDLIRKPPPTD